ncbi:MAG: hypothetical protein ACPHID_08610 [Thermoplasmatota archaeon]
MEETVDCQECGQRYDSNEHPFCPRCGSEKSPERRRTMDLAQRSDPGRRRVQIGGLILAAVAALALVQFLVAAFDDSPPDAATLDMLSGVELMRDAPGGTLELIGEGTYELRTMDGIVLANGTIMGAATLELNSTFTNLTLQGDIYRHLYVPDDEHVTIAVSELSPGGPEWIAAGSVGAMQIIAGFMAFFAALTVLGGVMAFRLRQRRLAYLGCGLALLPGLILVILVPAAGLLLLILPGVATGLIVSGRHQFE